MIKMSLDEQATYIYIPGKNWKLSLAELVSFSKARRREFRLEEVTSSHFVAALDRAVDPSDIDLLGGILKVGKVLTRFPTEIIGDAFIRRKETAMTEIRASLAACPLSETFETNPRKCIFGVSLYLGDQRFRRVAKKIHRFTGSYFKSKLRSQGTNCKFLGIPEHRELPQLTNVEVLRKNLVKESAEILVCIGNEESSVSSTVAVHNPFEFQKRDIGRPFQRKIFSIPPRLAKIMVNLASCVPGKMLLDPFCGVGTILQEALLIKAEVMGIDINPWCVDACSKNLNWLRGEYGLHGANPEVLLGDSLNLTDLIDERTFDCVVTEPNLGPALRQIPTKSYASKIINRLAPDYLSFLEEAHNVLGTGGKLVLVTPLIRTRSQTFVQLEIKERATAVGYEIAHPFEDMTFVKGSLRESSMARMSSLIDAEERHKIGREIHILQK